MFGLRSAPVGAKRVSPARSALWAHCKTIPYEPSLWSPLCYPGFIDYSLYFSQYTTIKSKRMIHRFRRESLYASRACFLWQPLFKSVLSCIRWYSRRISAIKTGTAIIPVSGKLPKVFNRKKTERIRPNDLCNFRNGMMTGDQVFAGIDICSIKTGV